MKIIFEVGGSDVEVLEELDYYTVGRVRRMAERIASECVVGLSDVNMRFVEE